MLFVTNYLNFLKIRFLLGKFPHLLLEDENGVSSEATLNFGKIVTGESVTKYITIINMTEVRKYLKKFLNIV
jgi:hypothetical protein